LAGFLPSTVVFQPFILGGELAVSFREGMGPILGRCFRNPAKTAPVDMENRSHELVEVFFSISGGLPEFLQ